ncbi:MAG: TetR/AcrR family transcriptional regulator [Deltaproteobacteria bacterium]|nr:MAG: TetR/AcrR family transcriptional regulator [Deltaproteobacteria bacterium]
MARTAPTAAATRRPGKPPRRRTQAERSALSEKLMLRAAVKLIARQGYSRTTLAEIGKVAGYSGGLVSHRFGSKQDLLRALVERMTTRFAHDQMIPAIEGRAGLDALCEMGDTYLRELAAREERLRALYVLMGEALGPVPELRSVFAELNESIRSAAGGCIRRGIEEGRIRADVDPGAGAAMFLALLRGVAMQWLVDPGAVDLAALRESVKETIRRSLAR